MSRDGDPIPDGEFSWNDFRLDTIKEKLFYVLVSRIGGFWSGNTEEELDKAIAENIADFPEFTREEFEEAMSGSVDHESVGNISAEQARDPYIVVFGGNDNDEGSRERADAIRNGEVDWDLTEMDYNDAANISPTDVKGLEKAQVFRQRGY